MSVFEWLREQWESGQIWWLLGAYTLGAITMLLLLLGVESLS